MRFTSLLVAATAVAVTFAQQTDEASAAGITDPVAECTPYGVAAITALQSANAFPPIWQIANLSKADSGTVALFNALNSTIPNWAPAGTPLGDFRNVTYDGATDPHCWWSWKQCTTPKISQLQPDVVRAPEPNTWGLTFDDGPNCSHNAFYDYLNSINQKATLFYIGSNVLDWPYEAQRGLDEGHEICAHTWSHRYMTALTNEEVFAELYYSKLAIKAVLGVTVQCWRPPFGDVDDRVRYIAQALGMSTVLWIDNTFDYLISTTNLTYVQNNYKAVFAKQSAGDYNTAGTIVLTHELNNDTMTIAESFLPQIQSQFKHVAPVGVCMNNTNPYVEQSGYSYPNFEQWAAGTRSASVATATIATSSPSLSVPLSAGQTGSLFASLPYQTASAATVAAPTGTTVAGNDNAGATGAGSSTTSSAKATSTVQGGASSLRIGVDGGFMTALAAILAGLVAGAFLL